jgi:shikimate dehydrogenase
VPTDSETAADTIAGTGSPPSPSAATRLFALLGDPVAHSLSPRIHNAALRHFGIDAIYVALRCDGQSVGPLIRALARAGGGGSVTIPHKQDAALCLDRQTAAVTRTGACNAFWGEDEAVCGDNTDVEGFRHAALEFLPALRGARVLVAGAGGAASAVMCVLSDGGAANITLLNRSPDRARRLAERFDPGRRVVHVATSLQDLADLDFDLLVNATSVGLGETSTLPVPLDAPRSVGAVLDLVYTPSGETPFVRAARSGGIPAADGTGMLIAQAAAAFDRWFGIRPPLELLQAALADRGP